MKIYKGNLIYTKSPVAFTVIQNGYVGVDNGVVVFTGESIPSQYAHGELVDFGESLIVPGFIDLHFHAPQYANLGLGFDMELLPWLNEYTFPEEAKFGDLEYAKSIYKAAIKDLWQSGTTRVVLFSTLHTAGTIKLMELLEASGLSGFVGKVNMDQNAPEYLVETTKESIEETRAWIEQTQGKFSRVAPIVTPRFVPTCSSELMHGLSALAERYNLPIQSHISENEAECQWVGELHPDCDSYSSVYDAHGLLTHKTVMAHCVHMNASELERFKRKGTYAAHCPNANYNLSSGIMPLRKFLNEGIHVGLGTDVGAGHKVSIADVMCSAIQASKIAWKYLDDKLKPLSLSEAFYLGTKGGGSFFGDVGSFEIGYSFDALVINDDHKQAIKACGVEERLHRFIYSGCHTQIVKRFVMGNDVEEPFKFE